MQATYNYPQEFVVGNQVTTETFGDKKVSTIKEIYDFDRFTIIVPVDDSISCIIFDKKDNRFYPLHSFRGLTGDFKAIEYDCELYVYLDIKHISYFFGDNYYKNYRRGNIDYSKPVLEILKYQLDKKDIDHDLVNYGTKL